SDDDDHETVPEEETPERDERRDDDFGEESDEEAPKSSKLRRKQQAAKKQGSGAQFRRTLGFKQKVSEKVRVTVDDLDEKFEDAKNAHNFWMDMWQLVASCHGLRRSWEVITEKLDEARTKRKTGNFKGVFHTNKWQPWGVNCATKLPSESVSQFSPAGPRMTEREGDPDLHVLFCPIGTPKPLSDDQSGVRCIQVIPGDRHCGSMMTSVEDKWGSMEEDAGPGMVFQVGLDRLKNPDLDAPEPTGADAKAVWVHSVVAAVLWARTKNYITAEFHTWEWLEDKIRGRMLERHLERPGKPLLIFLHLRRPHWREENSETSADINNLNYFLATARFKPGIHFYPNVKEVLADCD
ncbi:hypothetical protein CDV36_014349, partial [Fusarium kuroshium]